MPSVLVRNGRVVTRNGRAVLDTPSCRTLCCGGGPTDCCPSVCGERFRYCLLAYSASSEYTTPIRYEFTGGPVTDTVRETLTRSLEASPIDGQPPFAGCFASARVPIRTDETRNYPEVDPAAFCDAPDDTFSTVLECPTIALQCLPITSETTTALPSQLIDNLAQMFPVLLSRFGQRLIVAVPAGPSAEGVSPDVDSGTYSYQFTLPQPGQPAILIPVSLTVVVQNRWSFVDMGDGTFRLRVNLQTTRTATPSVPFPGSTVGPCIDYILSNNTIDTFAVEFRVIPVIKCDGSAGPNYTCNEPDHACDEDLDYIRGLPCIGQTPQPPDVVFLARNVSACRVMAVGTACYIVKPTNPRTNDPTGAIIDYRIVDANAGSSTCCACISDCPNQYIQARPCWQNVSRGPTGAYVIGESQIDPDPCCCSENDIITINQISGDITFTGQRTQYWRLRDGPISFRRGDTAFAREIYSSVKYADGSNVFGGPDSPGFLHGELSNNPPLDCAWGSDLGNFIQFGVPQNGAAAQPVGSNTLPCPSTPGLSLGGWTIENYSVSATCREFTYQATYTYSGGGTFRALTTVTVTPSPDSENQRCGGGCKPPPPAGVLSIQSIRDIIG